MVRPGGIMFKCEVNNQWAATVGVGLLAAASFAGCAARVEQSPEQILDSQPVASFRNEATSGLENLNPVDRAFLQQTMRMERALSAIKRGSDHRGWAAGAELNQAIRQDFANTEKMILDRIQATGSFQERQSLERLYESVHVTSNLFNERALAHRVKSGNGSSDGSMSHVHGLEAQLLLTRIRMTADTPSVGQ